MNINKTMYIFLLLFSMRVVASDGGGGAPDPVDLFLNASHGYEENIRTLVNRAPSELKCNGRKILFARHVDQNGDQLEKVILESDANAVEMIEAAGACKAKSRHMLYGAGMTMTALVATYGFVWGIRAWFSNSSQSSTSSIITPSTPI